MNEIDQSLAKEPYIISNRFATIYSNWGVTFILFFILFMSVYSIVNGMLTGIVFLVVALGGLSFNYGTDIDVNNNRYRDYVRIFFIKSGKWKSLQHYPFITVLKTNKGRSAFAGIHMSGHTYGSGTVSYGYGTQMSMDYSDGEFGIYLLNKSHYQKIEIELHNDLKKAADRVDYFAKAMNKEVVTYRPVRISSRR